MPCGSPGSRKISMVPLQEPAWPQLAGRQAAAVCRAIAADRANDLCGLDLLSGAVRGALNRWSADGPFCSLRQRRRPGKLAATLLWAGSYGSASLTSSGSILRFRQVAWLNARSRTWPPRILYGVAAHPWPDESHHRRGLRGRNVEPRTSDVRCDKCPACSVPRGNDDRWRIGSRSPLPIELKEECRRGQSSERG